MNTTERTRLSSAHHVISLIWLHRLEFPVVERRPIIGMAYVPASTGHTTFPCAGVLVQTLGSLWFFESVGTEISSTRTDSQSQEVDSVVSPSFNVTRRFQAHKLPVEGNVSINE